LADRPALPLAVLAATLGLAYVALAARIFAARRRNGDPRPDAALYTAFCILGKLPQGLGALRYYRDRNRPRHLIEYK
jgi:hypothetical protein